SEVVNSEAVNSEVVNSKVVNSKVVNPNNDADGHATQDLSIVPSSIASEPKTYGGDASSNTNVTNATISEVVPSPVFVVNTLTATKGVQYARLYADFFLAFFNILDDNMLHYGVQMNVEYNVLVKLFYNLFFRFCNKSTLEFGNNESTIVLCYCILQRYCLKVWKGTTVIYTDHGCLKVWKEPAVILSSYVYRSTRLALMLSTQYLVDYVYDMKSIAPSQDRKRFFEDEFEMLKVLDYNIFPCADKYEEIYKEIQILLTLPSEERKKKFIRA
ncbi:MAG: hypothetical protein LBB63_02990, partial [Holosporaceae bacterium]|nr:hypothetical protein [Holosporaceae bacterium]